MSEHKDTWTRKSRSQHNKTTETYNQANKQKLERIQSSNLKMNLPPKWGTSATALLSSSSLETHAGGLHCAS